ncbi:MAG: hypothetical protein ACM3KM_00885 [Acidobacteriaceae bacterium]
MSGLNLKVLATRIAEAKRILLLGALAAILIAFGAWFGVVKLNQKIKQKLQPNYYSNVKADQYSLNGIVTGHGENELTLEVGTVKINDGKGLTTFKQYKISFDDSTEVFKLSKNPDDPFPKASLSDLETAKEAIIYTHDQPYDLAEAKAFRIDITQ